MKPGTAVLVILPLVAVVAAFVLVSTRGAGAGSATGASGWDPEIEAFVRDQVTRTYVDDLDEARGTDAFYKAMDGYLHDLDEYCDFIPPDEYRKWKEHTAGEYAGLGVKIQALEDGLLVVGALPAGPAGKSGIQPGDTLIAADGHPLAGLDLNTLEATRLLKGEPGSTVDVTIVPGPRAVDEPLPDRPKRIVKVKRALVRPPTVFARRVGPDASIGVIRLTKFAEATQPDFDAALDAMLADGVKGLVLDLRENGGGVLPTAVAIVNRFVDRGIIVRMEGRARGATRRYEAKADGTISKDVPLIVLVNGHSASASEVVSGALQDHRRALLVGERTYGKFLVQQITAVPGRDAAVQLTTSRYYLPSGRSYQRQKTKGNGRGANGTHRPAAGILPDVVVPLETENRTRLEKAFANEEAGPWNEKPPFPEVPGDEVDSQLQRALDLLQGQLVLRKIRSSR